MLGGLAGFALRELLLADVSSVFAAAGLALLGLDVLLAKTDWYRPTNAVRFLTGLTCGALLFLGLPASVAIRL